MFDETELTKLIGEIYEGVLEPEQWDAALRRFLGMCGGRYAFVGVIDSVAKTLAASSLVGPETSRLDDAMQLHRKEMIPLDPGLLETQEPRVRAAYRRARFRLAARRVNGDWSILWLRRRAAS